ncbi:CapM protein, capsular polysaccharide biosynthesis [Legionella nautarum]|uniref:CapM protein, capsular polysaccharide biosynthesis n=1 Tax=Legionella nautarum TaxID=45070 RepID=A0A0W0X4A0_9GAMM|nr:GT4 family glycosyltransferase PelF [Legionella nautarum]KTD39427.1 CapM protein, capsular polysaccharide biosynthesis [Legionella nautarum]
MNPYFFKEQSAEVDIALILEGSYPMIYGGVSAWVHQIIENFPQYSFALIFLGGAPEHYKDGIRYELPDNVLNFQIFYLFDEDDPALTKTSLTSNEEAFAFFQQMHESFKCPHSSLKKIEDISLMMEGPNGVDYGQFLYSELSWEYIKEQYTKQCEDASFIDYFWTIRNIHKPLWKFLSILKTMPKTKLVHTISTGYAGLLSFFIQRHFNYPVVLTEHGIYTKERQIDIFLSQIIRDDPERSLTETSYLRHLWDRYFKTLAALTYHVSDPIVSLFNHAHQIQIDEGADEKKAIVVPNGINIGRFKPLRRPLEDKLPIICFIGRVVPIKDIKGFIRAVPTIHNAIPELKVWIIGSTDQDPEYAQECMDLVDNTLLGDIVEFIPHQQLEDILPNVKLVILSGLRESMPLVLLESFGAGIPVVATDVGACKEMVLGSDGEDAQLGPAGKIVKVADTRGLETAILEILNSPKLWNQMSQSAIKRVEKYYDERLMIERYQQIYKKVMS